MLRLNLLIACFLLLGLGARAQFILKGRVMEDKTRLKLDGVRVDNLSNKQSALTDNNGMFSIKADKNQLLVFNVFSYEPDTVLVTGSSNLEIYLTLQTHGLKSVNVTAAEGPASLHIYDPDFHGQTVAYQTDAAGNKKGGIVVRFWYWKKTEHKRERQEQNARDEQTKLQIAKAFSPGNLSGFLPLKGAEMDHFIVLYTPSPQVYNASDFNMLSYLESCYKKFVLLPAAERSIIDSLK